MKGGVVAGAPATGPVPPQWPEVNGSPIKLGMIMNTNYLQSASGRASGPNRRLLPPRVASRAPAQVEVCETEERERALPPVPASVNDSSVIGTVVLTTHRIGSQYTADGAKIVGIGGPKSHRFW